MTECFKDKYIYNSEVLPASTFDDSILEKENVVYEVVRLINGEPFQVEYNSNRLQRSLNSAKIDYIADVEKFRSDIIRLAKLNNVEEGNVKILVFKDGERVSTLMFFIRHYYPTYEQLEYGVVTKTLKAERNNPTAKVINKNLRKLANSLIERDNVFEIVLVDLDGYVTEGSRSNIFFVKSGVVYTTPDEFVLPGTARKRVIEICNNLSIEVVKERMLYTDIKEVDAVFLTGTSLGVLPILKIDNKEFDVNDSVMRVIQTKYLDILSAQSDKV